MNFQLYSNLNFQLLPCINRTARGKVSGEKMSKAKLGLEGQLKLGLLFSLELLALAKNTDD